MRPPSRGSAGRYRSGYGIRGLGASPRTSACQPSLALPPSGLVQGHFFLSATDPSLPSAASRPSGRRLGRTITSAAGSPSMVPRPPAHEPDRHRDTQRRRRRLRRAQRRVRVRRADGHVARDGLLTLYLVRALGPKDFGVLAIAIGLGTLVL